jgi:putative transposase
VRRVLYVVLDIFSRYVVAWMVAERENAALAKQLFAEAISRYGIEPGEPIGTRTAERP